MTRLLLSQVLEQQRHSRERRRGRKLLFQGFCELGVADGVQRAVDPGCPVYSRLTHFPGRYFAALNQIRQCGSVIPQIF